MADEPRPTESAHSRESLRRFYLESWRKARAGEVVSPLEELVVGVAELHPEYHGILENRAALDRDFPPEAGQTNPFLHLSLHVAVREQLSADRPVGIRGLYESLAGRYANVHELEHALIDCLAETLWKLQQPGQAPDEGEYLDCVRQLRKSRKGRSVPR